MKAVILAGGKGTRLAPYTTIFPKPMLPIGDKPILDIVIEQLSYYGFNDITISVGYLAELMETYYLKNSRIPDDVNLTFIREDNPLGTAGALSLIPELNESFLVMNGDVLTSLDYGKFMEYHKQNKGMVTVTMHKRKVDIDFGVIHTTREQQLIDYTEKPTLDYLVSMGVYMFEPEVLNYIESHKRLDFPDLIKKLLAKGKKVQGYENEEFWLDIGRHDDYEEAIRIFDSVKDRLLRSHEK
jgi:NDP-sugar pyrophosphorylase family protein